MVGMSLQSTSKMSDSKAFNLTIKMYWINFNTAKRRILHNWTTSEHMGQPKYVDNWDGRLWTSTVQGK